MWLLDHFALILITIPNLCWKHLDSLKANTKGFQCRYDAPCSENNIMVCKLETRSSHWTAHEQKKTRENTEIRTCYMRLRFPVVFYIVATVQSPAWIQTFQKTNCINFHDQIVGSKQAVGNTDTSIQNQRRENFWAREQEVARKHPFPGSIQKG